MLRGPRGLIITLLGAAAVIALAIFFGFQGQKGDVETSRNFLSLAADGNMEEAHSLLHPGVGEQTSVAELGQILAGMEVYTDISFPSFSFSTNNGTRETRIDGTGTTATGCVSELTFELLNGDITFFNIEPLCRSEGTDT